MADVSSPPGLRRRLSCPFQFSRTSCAWPSYLLWMAAISVSNSQAQQDERAHFFPGRMSRRTSSCEWKCQQNGDKCDPGAHNSCDCVGHGSGCNQPYAYSVGSKKSPESGSLFLIPIAVIGSCTGCCCAFVAYRLRKKRRTCISWVQKCLPRPRHSPTYGERRARSRSSECDDDHEHEPGVEHNCSKCKRSAKHAEEDKLSHSKVQARSKRAGSDEESDTRSTAKCDHRACSPNSGHSPVSSPRNCCKSSSIPTAVDRASSRSPRSTKGSHEKSPRSGSKSDPKHSPKQGSLKITERMPSKYSGSGDKPIGSEFMHKGGPTTPTTSPRRTRSPSTPSTRSPSHATPMQSPKTEEVTPVASQTSDSKKKKKRSRSPRTDMGDTSKFAPSETRDGADSRMARAKHDEEASIDSLSREPSIVSKGSTKSSRDNLQQRVPSSLDSGDGAHNKRVCSTPQGAKASLEEQNYEVCDLFAQRRKPSSYVSDVSTDVASRTTSVATSLHNVIRLNSSPRQTRRKNGSKSPLGGSPSSSRESSVCSKKSKLSPRRKPSKGSDSRNTLGGVTSEKSRTLQDLADANLEAQLSDAGRHNLEAALQSVLVAVGSK